MVCSVPVHPCKVTGATLLLFSTVTTSACTHPGLQHWVQEPRQQRGSTPRAVAFNTFPQLPLGRSPHNSAKPPPSASKRVQLQPAPTEDPAKRLDQAVRLLLTQAQEHVPPEHLLPGPACAAAELGSILSALVGSSVHPACWSRRHEWYTGRWLLPSSIECSPPRPACAQVRELVGDRALFSPNSSGSTGMRVSRSESDLSKRSSQDRASGQGSGVLELDAEQVADPSARPEAQAVEGPGFLKLKLQEA